MFQLVVLWGAFSYLILVMGWASLLNPVTVTGSLVIFLAVSGFVCLRKAKTISRQVQRAISAIRGSKFMSMLVLILVIQGLINLVGAIGPELGFDALWYHLTIGRIWLLEGKIFNIPGGYFYYSLLPKSIDLVYLSLLPIFGQWGPKLLHWLLGLLAAMVTYKIARKWLDQKWSLLAAVIFYTNLVVGWQSITAYVDLGRTALEALAFYYLINRQTTKSAVVLGLAITTKFLAVGSIPIFLLLLLMQKMSFKNILGFALTAILIPSPWFIWAYLQIGNPIYPVFSDYDLASVRHIWDVVTIWLRAADPISPIYFLVFPIWFIYRRKVPLTVTAYCLLSLAIWWVIPRSGGGRFLLPYLPVFSVGAVYVISLLKNHSLQKILVGAALIIAVFNLGWRALANAKYIPVILHMQTQSEFLDRYLYKSGHNFYYLPDDQLKKLYGGS